MNVDKYEKMAREFLGDKWLDKEGPIDAQATLAALLRSVAADTWREAAVLTRTMTVITSQHGNERFATRLETVSEFNNRAAAIEKENEDG
jgi:hypothetical protein